MDYSLLLCIEKRQGVSDEHKESHLESNLNELVVRRDKSFGQNNSK